MSPVNCTFLSSDFHSSTVIDLYCFHIGSKVREEIARQLETRLENSLSIVDLHHVNSTCFFVTVSDIDSKSITKWSLVIWGRNALSFTFAQ